LLLQKAVIYHKDTKEKREAQTKLDDDEQGFGSGLWSFLVAWWLCGDVSSPKLETIAVSNLAQSEPLAILLTACCSCGCSSPISLVPRQSLVTREGGLDAVLSTPTASAVRFGG